MLINDKTDPKQIEFVLKAMKNNSVKSDISTHSLLFNYNVATENL